MQWFFVDKWSGARVHARVYNEGDLVGPWVANEIPGRYRVSKRHLSEKKPASGVLKIKTGKMMCFSLERRTRPGSRLVSLVHAANAANAEKGGWGMEGREKESGASAQKSAQTQRHHHLCASSASCPRKHAAELADAMGCGRAGGRAAASSGLSGHATC